MPLDTVFVRNYARYFGGPDDFVRNYERKKGLSGRAYATEGSLLLIPSRKE